MQYDRLVIGYHGCHAKDAERLLGGEPFKPSTQPYDWLGRGSYFWEYGLDRAWQWATTDPKRRKAPAVVGALIQLGGCFDLLDTYFTNLLASMTATYVDKLRKAHKAIPLNLGKTRDLKGRYFDCAAINWTLAELERDGVVYQSVRGAFLEGTPVFKLGAVKSGILRQNHIQIAVRDPRCIVGVFRPR